MLRWVCYTDSLVDILAARFVERLAFSLFGRSFMAHLSNLEGIEMEGKLPDVRLATTPFRAVSPFEPAGDQPQAIEKLAHGIEDGLRYQTLLGVTGSGKTFTMAKTIEAVQKPTLVMAPNKTLAAQLASELKEVLKGYIENGRSTPGAPQSNNGQRIWNTIGWLDEEDGGEIKIYK